MQKRNLSSRHKLILTYMNGKHSVVPGRELAERLRVSTRTVRFEVSEINDILKNDGISIEAVSGKGYRLSVTDRALFHELISDRNIIHTKEDRIVYLIMRFISSDDWVDIPQLEDEMFVSRTTLENDIREIRKRICDHEPCIMMKRRKNALLLEDDEMKKRNILLRLYSENWDFDSREGISFRNGLADREILEEIRQELVRVLREYRIDLDDYGMVNMKIAVSLVYSRNIEGHRLYNAGADKRYGTCRYAVNDLLGRLAESWELELEEADYIWLAGFLERLQVLGLNQRNYESAVKTAGEDCTAIADRLTEDLAGTYGIRFPDDEIFRTQLLLAVRAYLNRQMSTQAQSRFVTDLLEKNYAFLGDASRYLGERLIEISGKQYREGEENWLLPILCSAAERKERAQKNRIRVGIISHVNDGLTQYLRDNFEKLFGTRCTVIAVSPVHNRRDVLLMKPSMVIATVRMKLFAENGIPCVVTSPIITEEELTRIDACLQSIERASLHEDLPYPFELCLERGGEFEADKKSSAAELLDQAVSVWKERGLIPEEACMDSHLFRYVPLNRDDFLIYRAGGLRGPTSFTRFSVNRNLLCEKQRNVRKLYIGFISEEDRQYLPAIFGKLDSPDNTGPDA